MKLRNKTDDTYVDFATGQVAEPGEVITVPDDAAHEYENHSVWEAVPEVAPRKTAEKE